MVNFTSVSNKLYSVERSDELTSNVWTTVTNNVAGTGDVLQILDTDAAIMPQRFYRVRLLP